MLPEPAHVSGGNSEQGLRLADLRRGKRRAAASTVGLSCRCGAALGDAGFGAGLGANRVCSEGVKGGGGGEARFGGGRDVGVSGESEIVWNGSEEGVVGALKVCFIRAAGTTAAKRDRDEVGAPGQV